MRMLISFLGRGCAALVVVWVLATGAFANNVGLSYLEALGRPGALPDRIAYVPPSRIDPAYTHVIYVNAATSGAAAQKMWVLERSRSGWRTALWDAGYWEGKLTGNQRPPYSWPVSTGRKYPGEKRSGPTPLGIFNMDERNSRHRRGWGSPGMWNSIYIDLHYNSGRASGVAMHGTTRGLYRRLGTADSHGCVRMHQSNADQIWAMIHPNNVKGEASPLWGRVPRYFRSEPNPNFSVRRGYVRDGSLLYPEVASNADTHAERLERDGYTVLLVFYRDDLK